MRVPLLSTCHYPAALSESTERRLGKYQQHAARLHLKIRLPYEGYRTGLRKEREWRIWAKGTVGQTGDEGEGSICLENRKSWSNSSSKGRNIHSREKGTRKRACIEFMAIVLNNVKGCWSSWERKSKIIYSVQKQMKLRQTKVWVYWKCKDDSTFSQIYY